MIEGTPSVDGNSTSSNRITSLSQIRHAPTHLQTLPQFIFTDPSHLSINRTIITRTELGMDNNGYCRWSSLLLSAPFTSGVISVTFAILSLPHGSFYFGLMDSNYPIPKHGEALGFRVENSVGLNTYGDLWVNTPSSDSYHDCHPSLHEGDCLRMEVDLDSTPRTVQFFWNGKAGRWYVSGIPSSVRIGFSVDGEGTSFRIDNISRLSRPTQISEGMREYRW